MQLKKRFTPFLIVNFWGGAALLALIIWRFKTLEPPGGPFALAALELLALVGLALLCGQLAQLGCFRRAGWKMRAWGFGGFLHFREHGAWCTVSCGAPAGGVLALGLYVPALPDITNEDEFAHACKIMANACKARAFGWNAAALACCALGLGLSFALPGRLAFCPLLGAGAAVALAAALNLQACRTLDGCPGALAQAALLRDDPFFAAYRLYALYILQEDGGARRRENSYVREKLTRALAELAPENDTRFVLEAVDLLLTEELAGVFPADAGVARHCDYFAQSPRRLLHGPGGMEIYPILYLRIACALRLRGCEQWKLLEPNVSSVLNNLRRKETGAYFRLQTLQIIYGEDHRSELCKRENVKNSSSWALYRRFAHAFDDELCLNLRGEREKT